MEHGVAASPFPQRIFILLLILSVGGKIAVGHQSPRGAEGTIERTTKVEIAAFLNHQGFRVDSSIDQPESPFVSAVAADCHLIAMLAAPQGWNRSILRLLAKGQDQILFVYSSTIYQDQPVWLTWTDHYWRLLNRYAGRKLPAQPVLGVVASSTCNLRDMPWRELPDLS